MPRYLSRTHSDVLSIVTVGKTARGVVWFVALNFPYMLSFVGLPSAAPCGSVWGYSRSKKNTEKKLNSIYLFGSSDFPVGDLSRIQIKPAAVEIDGDLEVVTVPESTGTFLYSCNL